MRPDEEINSAHRTHLRVRYAETDQMGVVYHANYLVWMEIGRVELVRSRGFNYKDLESDGYFLSVVDVQCRYLFPARYDQEVVVETQVENSNPRMVEFAYLIQSVSPARSLAQARTRHVWLNRDMRPCRLPPQYQGVLHASRKPQS